MNLVKIKVPLKSNITKKDIQEYLDENCGKYSFIVRSYILNIKYDYYFSINQYFKEKYWDELQSKLEIELGIIAVL